MATYGDAVVAYSVANCNYNGLTPIGVGIMTTITNYWGHLCVLMSLLGITWGGL